MDTTMPTLEVEELLEAHLAAETEVQPQLMFGAKDGNLIRQDRVDLLRRSGLRPTQQRLLLLEQLFSKGGRHVTADMLYTQAISAGINISLATVYNTLKLFTEAGLLCRISVDGTKSYFDTNPNGHHHFFFDHEDRLLDVPEPGVLIDTLPQALPGYEISRVDVVIHLRRKQA
jgi:Fur family iron response transcriptional regulator